MTRQKKNFKTVSVHYINTDLILKMIKKAKISRVRVPLNVMFPIFLLIPMHRLYTLQTFRKARFFYIH